MGVGRRKVGSGGGEEDGRAWGWEEEGTCVQHGPRSYVLCLATPSHAYHMHITWYIILITCHHMDIT